MRISLNNAEALIEEARILLDADHPARALALAILASEELGKLPLYANVDTYAAKGRMQQWWKRFRSHTEKIARHEFLTLAFRVKEFGEEEMRALVENRAGKTLHRLKMAALYTDFQSGRFISPLELPNAQELAQAAIIYAMVTLQIHHLIVDRLTPDVLYDYWHNRDAWAREAENVPEAIEANLRESLGEKRFKELVQGSEWLQESIAEFIDKLSQPGVGG